MERKNNIFTNIFIAILIIVFVYIVPLILVNSYSKIYTNMYKGKNMLLYAYDELQNSDINTQYKDYVTIIKKSTESTLQRMQSGYCILFTYYTIFTCFILLVLGICLKKNNINISRICIATSVILFICTLAYIANFCIL